MKLELDLYMKGIIGFFKENPNSLISLVPKEMEGEFYSMIRKTAELNLELNEEPTLTKVQIIEIAKELNYRVSTNNYTDNIFMVTKNWGKICLN